MNNGIHIHEADPFYVQALAEHRELHAAVERIRRLLASGLSGAEGGPTAVDAVHAVGNLRDQLQRHFEQEEAGGYLEEAVARLPQIAPQAKTLQRQHREFLDLANAMLAAAESEDSATSMLPKLKTDFDLFAKRLEAHEAAENILLERAFNEDQGLEP